MQLFSIAGGAGPGDEDVLSCCGWFPILPLVLLLAGLAVYRNSIWVALGALLLAGLPYLILWQMVASYQPSDDGDVVADQAVGRRAVGFYASLVGVAGVSVLGVTVRRSVGWRWKRTEPVAAPDRRGPHGFGSTAGG